MHEKRIPSTRSILFTSALCSVIALVSAFSAFAEDCRNDDTPKREKIINDRLGLSCVREGDHLQKWALFNHRLQKFVDKMFDKPYCDCVRVLAASTSRLTCANGTGYPIRYAVYDFQNEVYHGRYFDKTLDECISAILIEGVQSVIRHHSLPEMQCTPKH